MTPESRFEVVEGLLIHATEWIKLTVEATGVVVIGIGVIIAIYQFIQAFITQQAPDFGHIRLTLARYLALALEFQLGADILSTAIAPSWEAIGKLGAIAVIRTGLNFFLMQEMKVHQKTYIEPP